MLPNWEQRINRILGVSGVADPQEISNMFDRWDFFGIFIHHQDKPPEERVLAKR
jgi:hypothetical protein